MIDADAADDLGDDPGRQLHIAPIPGAEGAALPDPAERPDAPEPLFTGEMVYPWYFEEDPALRPLRQTADLLAAKPDWPALYDCGQLAANTVPVAAAVYTDDIYVDRDLSLETAEAVRGLKVWETAEFHHDGIADDGEGIFNRLLGMVRGGE